MPQAIIEVTSPHIVARADSIRKLLAGSVVIVGDVCKPCS